MPVNLLHLVCALPNSLLPIGPPFLRPIPDLQYDSAHVPLPPSFNMHEYRAHEYYACRGCKNT